MRLFEFAHGKFQDDLRNILKVLQGRADEKKTTSEVPWLAINNMLKGYGYAEVNSDMLDKIKDSIDKDDNLIQAVTPNGVVLKTNIPSSKQEKPLGGVAEPKSVDQMAHNVVSKGLQ